MGRTIGLAAALLAAAALFFVFMGGTSLMPNRSAAIETAPGTAKGISPSKAATPSPTGNAAGAPKGKGGAGGPVTVEVAQARKAKAANDIRAIGSLQSDESVKLAPEIAGRISEIVFAEGRPVKQGDIIIKLDDALARAELAQSKARLELAAANNQRARTLSRSGNVTERTSDEAQANFETATAERELAQARLDKHVLRAPFDGVAGVRTVSVGAFVTAGMQIVNIEKIDQLKVDFKVPELYLSSVTVRQQIELQVDALPGRTFTGEIYAINPLLDVNGRALQIRARLANTDQTLRPGLFARVIIKGLAEREVVIVPEAAILPRGGDTFVYRVESGKAFETRVKIGERSNGEVEIVEGLLGDSTIVVAGQQRLRDGSPVEIVPTAAAQRAPGTKAPANNTPPAPASGGRS